MKFIVEIGYNSYSWVVSVGSFLECNECQGAASIVVVLPYFWAWIQLSKPCLTGIPDCLKHEQRLLEFWQRANWIYIADNSSSDLYITIHDFLEPGRLRIYDTVELSTSDAIIDALLLENLIHYRIIKNWSYFYPWIENFVPCWESAILQNYLELMPSWLCSKICAWILENLN